MSRQLILLRHAKANWGAAHEDSARELNQIGVAEASHVGNWLQTHRVIPDLVLCSTATRAVQTWEALAKTAGLERVNLQFEPSLYLAELAVLSDLLQNIALHYHTVMLLGHNPGLEDLAMYLSKTTLPRTFAGELLATANLVHFSLPDDWHDLARQGEVAHIFRP